MNMTQINETSYGKVIIRAVTASEAERVTSLTRPETPGSAEILNISELIKIFLILHHAPTIFHRGEASCPSYCVLNWILFDVRCDLNIDILAWHLSTDRDRRCWFNFNLLYFTIKYLRGILPCWPFKWCWKCIYHIYEVGMLWGVSVCGGWVTYRELWN